MSLISYRISKESLSTRNLSQLLEELNLPISKILPFIASNRALCLVNKHIYETTLPEHYRNVYLDPTTPFAADKIQNMLDLHNAGLPKIENVFCAVAVSIDKCLMPKERVPMGMDALQVVMT